jgi:hypothetical protein
MWLSFYNVELMFKANENLVIRKCYGNYFCKALFEKFSVSPATILKTRNPLRLAKSASNFPMIRYQNQRLFLLSKHFTMQEESKSCLNKDLNFFMEYNEQKAIYGHIF